ncbi:hypothetical protein [Nocardiopsis nanhaiensis]
MSEQASTPRTGRRFSDALIRLQIRNQNEPRRAGPWLGLFFGLLLFLGMALGLFVGVGAGADDRPFPFPVLLFVALPGAALGGALFAVLMVVMVKRTVRSNPLPAEADPADVRAARKVFRSGEASGDPEVDRIARILAAQALRGRLQSPKAILYLFGALGGLSVLQVVAQYTANDGWTWLAVMYAGLAVLFCVYTAVFYPLAVRQRRRIRAFAAAYDEGAGHPDGEAGSPARGGRGHE